MRWLSNSANRITNPLTILTAFPQARETTPLVILSPSLTALMKMASTMNTVVENSAAKIPMMIANAFHPLEDTSRSRQNLSEEIRSATELKAHASCAISSEELVRRKASGPTNGMKDQDRSDSV
jgi:hypothetical protein